MNHNTGHGHVVPRPDGVKARCGGPGICQVCAAERTAQQAGPITHAEVLALADAFERSAAWLLTGELQKPQKDFPLVGLADYQRASKILRAAAFVWAQGDTP